MSILQPEPCPPSGGRDVESLLLCDVVDGVVVGSALAVYKYDSVTGSPVGPPTFVDPATGDPYVVQGTLQPCSGGGGGTGDEVVVTNQVEVKNDVGNPLAVSGTVALDPATLAALETINALVSGTVALDAPTLAALENIVVTGTVALDAPTLAALETISAVVSGTVALDGPTLAALETITAVVSGTVSVDNFPSSVEISNDVGNPVPVSGSVEVTGEIEVKNDTGNPIPVSDAGGSLTVDAAEKYSLLSYAKLRTADDVISPSAPGNSLELVWVQVMPNPDNTTSNLVTIRMTIGGVLTDIYAVYVVGRTAVFTGDPGTDIEIDLSTTQPTTVNIQYREVS